MLFSHLFHCLTDFPVGIARQDIFTQLAGKFGVSLLAQAFEQFFLITREGAALAQVLIIFAFAQAALQCTKDDRGQDAHLVQG